MKRILTSILLLVVLTLSVHPIFTLHFCQGELHSFTVVSENEANSCCVLSNITENINPDNQLSNLRGSSNSCCSYTSLELVTDNFTLNSSQSIQTPNILSSIPGWFVINYLINLASPDTIINTNFNLPSYGFYLKTLDFLSLICIYRI